MKTLSLLLALSACGPVPPPPCEENRVWCDDRCLTVCNYGQVVTVRCLPCDGSLRAVTVVNQCEIVPVSCPKDAGPKDAGVPVWPS